MWRPLEPLTLIGEYHYNGFGAGRARDYVDKLQSARVTRGEVFGVGQHYVGLASAWTLDDLTSVSATGIVNVLDPSALFVAALERSFSDSLLLRAGATFPFGAGVDVERFTALAPDLGIRSEYGLTPFTVFLQLGVYFG
jgi:hypothetical protein